ncbi:MAG: sigma-54-dependent transcriptional regulator [Desulfovibrionaceae bacterium]
MASILIVDDDQRLRESFQRLLTAEGHNVAMASSGETGIERVRAERPDLVIMDVRMPGMDGLSAFKIMRDLEPDLQVIVMTAFGEADTAIEATKMGAFDFVLKPFDIPAMLDLIGKALEAARFARKCGVACEPEGRAGGVLLGRSAAMQEVCKSIGRAAPTEATVLIRGESGTGKELVARALYQHSKRSNGPFLVINCVAIPETLLESELFGYEKGAFTGASSRRVGKIELANRGTIFLDEIGDMPPGIQAKILRLLQERHIERLGGGKPIAVDVRIIAATNRDLEAAVAAGQFREDLYYRLKVVTLNLPPLRDRKEDVAMLADHFLDRFAREMGVTNPGITPEAGMLLGEYDWPGNVRELSNSLQKALIFNRGGPLQRDEIEHALDLVAASSDGAGKPDEALEASMRHWIRQELAAGGRDDAFDALMDHFGAAVVGEALNLTGGNRTRAAKLLGLSRPTLLSRIDKYGLTIEVTTTQS